jgi:hypothetical protein
MKVRALLSVLFLGVAFSLEAQQNKVVDDFLAQSPAKLGSAAYLVMVGAGRMPDASSLDEGFALAKKLGSLPAAAEASSGLKAEELALLVMKGFDIPGGVMYSILPTNRYAFKELVTRGVIDASTKPESLLSGEEALRVISGAASLPRRSK